MLSPHVDRYCLEIGSRWGLGVSNSADKGGDIFLNSGYFIIKYEEERKKTQSGCLLMLVCADEENSLVLVYILSGALVFIIILVVFLAYTIYKMLKTKSCQCTGRLN